MAVEHARPDCQDTVRPGPAPAHPGALEPFAHYYLTGRLRRAAADHETLRPELGVLHTLLVAREVADLAADRFALLFRLGFHPPQSAEQARRATLFELALVLIGPALAVSVALAVAEAGQVVDVLAGVPVVYDLDGAKIVLLRHFSVRCGP